MAPGDWAHFTRALRVQRRALEKELAAAPSDNTTVATSAALLTIAALESAFERMAGGKVFD